MAVTKAPGSWTSEDLLAVPDDGRRYELIDGEVYELSTPNFKHQQS